MCSGSVVEDIDMTEEIASVASDGRKGAALPHNTKGVEFASNILNDMGPPQALCSALLLAANAACRPSSSHCSLRSFDTNDGGAAPGSDAVSDVVAHLDTVCSSLFYLFCFSRKLDNWIMKLTAPAVVPSLLFNRTTAVIDRSNQK